MTRSSFFAWLLVLLASGCSRTLLRSGEELFGSADPGAVDAGPPDGGPPATLRCDWSWGPEVSLREYLTAFVAELAFGRSVPILRVEARSASGVARTVWDVDVDALVVADTFGADPTVDAQGAELLATDGAFIDVIPGREGCRVRTLAQPEEELVLRRSLGPPAGCFAFAQADSLVVSVVGTRDLSLHAVTGDPFDEVRAVGPFPGLEGRTFAWLQGDTFVGVRLATGGGLEVLEVDRGLTTRFAGTTDPEVQLAPDPARDRVFFLEWRGDGTSSLGVLLFGDPPRIERFPRGVAHRPDPTRALPIVAGELLIADADRAAVGFVPANGQPPRFLEAPERGASNLRVAAHPSMDRAAAAYAVPNTRGGSTLVVRRLDCRR